MNYRKTAEILLMSQPAVTQHIHFLEKEYGYKLFIYDGRVLSKTGECLEFEKYARSVVYNDMTYRKTVTKDFARKISIGATKTIGDYLIKDKVAKILKSPAIELMLIIDNTEHLLCKLNSLELDILLVEGYFDKANYGFQLLNKEELVGICAKNHSFANKSVNFSDIFQENIILREDGSGTRSVFQNFLFQNNYSINNFVKRSIISSFSLIEKAVEENCGISFVYKTISDKNKNFCTFKIDNREIFHEYNYVFLKGVQVQDVIGLFDKEPIL